MNSTLCLVPLSILIILISIIGSINGRKLDTCHCGEAQSVPGSIVNGTEANIGEFPWMVALVKKGSQRSYCGGSLISDRHIITAAHCISKMNKTNFDILLNEHNLNEDSETILPTVRAQVAHVLIHPEHKRGIYYDIALITLTSPVSFFSSFTPICLPKDLSRSYGGETATVIGWGLTSSGGEESNVLRKVNISVISNEECGERYPAAILPSMICASSPYRDACQGDSGGPLMNYQSLGGPGFKYTQIGVVSWGKGCALPKYPGVYSRITEMMDWIMLNTEDGTFCKF